MVIIKTNHGNDFMSNSSKHKIFEMYGIEEIAMRAGKAPFYLLQVKEGAKPETDSLSHNFNQILEIDDLTEENKTLKQRISELEEVVQVQTHATK